MADDGLLLNFTINDGIIKPETKFKGGTWRDRLTAKKTSLHRPKLLPSQHGNPNRIAINSENNGNGPNRDSVQLSQSLSSSRPHKKRKTEGGDFKPQAGPATTSASHHTGQSQSRAKPQQRQVISSLFTFNPTPKSGSGQTVGEDGLSASEPVKPSNAPLIDGLENFTDLGLSSMLATHLLTKMQLKAPTAVQKNSIPQLLKEESDAFIQAETGSGKTLAYLLPLVQRIMTLAVYPKHKDDCEPPPSKQEQEIEGAIHRDAGLFAIIMAPTRELCKQIAVVLESLLRCAHWIVAGTVIGGEKKKSEKARLRKGLNILVATPGRLADHLEHTKVLDVSRVRWLILDEGDRLMDLGFEEEIQGIVKQLNARQRPTQIAGLPPKRTTILCSATLKMNVQRLGQISLRDAVLIKLDPADLEEKSQGKSEVSPFSIPAQLKQSYLIAAAKLRLVTLTALLKRTFARKGSVMKSIIFVSCADSVEFHFEVFTRKERSDQTKDSIEKDKLDIPTHTTVASAVAFSNPSNLVTIHKLHGSLPQNVRTSTLSAFARSRDASVLICTDVASRGLDLPNVDLVIEYDPAFSSDDHLHRIGRTARLGRDGRALIFLLPGSEENYVEVLKRGYRDGGKTITQIDTNEILRRGFGGNTDAESKDWDAKATDWQLDAERWALESPQRLEIARRAFQSHIRAYATHVSSERSMFNIKELHLGHLAKSFALRDRPSKINVPGLRPSKEETKKVYKSERNKAASGKKRKVASNTSGTGANCNDDIIPRGTDEAEAARKMRTKMEVLTGIGEFNLA